MMVRFLLLALFLPSLVFAESEGALLRKALQTIEELKQEVRAQSERIRVLEAEKGPSAPANVTSVTNLSAFNPEIGVVGDIVASTSSSNEDDHGNDAIQLRSAEIVFGHDVDPYSRFDASIAFSDEHGAEVEEAYLTHHGLPFGTLGRFGQLKPRIGITPDLDLDQLDTVDMPLVVRRYFGEKGLSKGGVEFLNFLPFE